MTATAAERRLIEHVDRIEAEQPPIALESVDFTVLRPDVVRERFGGMLDYLARVELEVDRNVLELNTMLPTRRRSTSASTAMSGTPRRSSTA